MSYKVSSACLKSSLLAGFLLFLQPVFAQYNFEALDQEFQAKQKMLGKDAVLLVWKKDDTLIYKKETGDFNAKTAAPIGDASKWLTAALVMQFVDEGKLSLDDKITRWLPEFEKYGKNYITIGLCLSHMTGIKEPKNSRSSTLEDAVNNFASKEIRTNPGTDFWYGNIGISIAGRVLEVISKKKFDVLIKQKLFTPMEMRRTTFTTIDNSAVDPSGGASATPDDYMKFLVMLMNKGKYKNKQILSEESVNELFRIHTTASQITFAPKPMQGFNYTLGSWATEEKDGKPTVLACPGLPGAWPMIDLCRGYAYLFLPKKPVGDEKAETHAALKKVIDEQIPSTCN